MKISLEYNHVFVLLAAVGLFGLFLQGRGEGIFGKIAGKQGPYVLGVYLLHENIGLRYGWQSWFGAGRIQTVGQLLLGTVMAVLCIFVTGVIVEYMRSALMKGLNRGLSHLEGWRVLLDSLERADQIFAGRRAE
jgi:hypothetical protein